MQRYIDGPAGWKLLGSAVTGQTIADWDDDIYMSGVGGIDGNACCPIFYSCWNYDEAPLGPFQDSGWVAVTSVGTSLDVGTGYWTWVQPLPELISVEGPPTTGTTSIPVIYNSSGIPADDGWNLVANPYPSQVDWDVVAGWSKSNVADAVYIWKHPTWATYVAQIGTNGGSNVISSSQGFIVQTFGASPSLSINESAKSSAAPIFLKTAPNTDQILRLTIAGNGNQDETVIRFSQNATNAFDYSLDAQKWFTPSYYPAVPNLCTVMDSVDLSVNSLPAITEDVSIPLRTITGMNGSYTITLEEGSLPGGSCVVLEDLYLNTSTSLVPAASYTFVGSDTTTAPRFILHIGAPILNEVSTLLRNGDGDAHAVAEGAGTGPWSYEWKDAQNTVLQTTANTNATDTLKNLVAGIYMININGGLCGTSADTFEVAQPNVLTTAPKQNDVSCFGMADGSININSSGGTNPHTFLWSNNEVSEDIAGLQPGNYTVTLTDANNCDKEKSFTIEEPAEIIPSFAASAEMVYLDDGASVAFTNSSYGGSTYAWNFGDGSSASSKNAVHTYQSTGTYQVDLQISYKGNCAEAASKSITVGTEFINEVKVIQEGGSYFAMFYLEEAERAEISIYNVLGQESARTTLSAYREKVPLDLDDVVPGAYIVRISAGDMVVTAKVIVE